MKKKNRNEKKARVCVAGSFRNISATFLSKLIIKNTRLSYCTMANYSKTLLLMASRLGLNEKEKILSKAAEFERRLQTKLMNNKTISDMVRVAICLDLASTYCGEEFDLKAAVRLSGTKQNLYNSNKLFIENLLDMRSERLTAAALCVSLQCSAVQELAEEILEKYRDIKGIINLDLPQYVCMAVYQACRLHKLKVSKSKLIEKSRLKPGQFTKLEAEWTKFVDEHFTPVAKQKTAPRHTDEVETKMEVDTPPQKKIKDSDSQMEVYFKWKKRILDKAYKEIAIARKQGLLMDDSKNDEKKKSGPGTSTQSEKHKPSVHEDERRLKDFEFSLLAPPRRSPRKTPQKLPSDIYKSPATSKGIKLLFPNY